MFLYLIVQKRTCKTKRKDAPKPQISRRTTPQNSAKTRKAAPETKISPCKAERISQETWNPCGKKTPRKFGAFFPSALRADFSGRNPEDFLEHAAEVRLVLEARALGDFVDRVVRLKEELRRDANPVAVQVLPQAQPDLAVENPRQVVLADVHGVRELPADDLRRGVLVQVEDRLLDERARVRRGFRARGGRTARTRPRRGCRGRRAGACRGSPRRPRRARTREARESGRGPCGGAASRGRSPPRQSRRTR